MIKQVIVVRKDLKMPVGKLAAQVAHASMKALFERGHGGFDVKMLNQIYDIVVDDEIKQWLSGKFTKICLAVNSEAELLEVIAKCKAEGIMCSDIVDDGSTCFNEVPTLTCVGIGPYESDKIDKITGGLKLL